MPYKVFLVEDEVMTREGIRDSVPWADTGYQFCGEAPDGEMALPLIREQQPDVVITDIKMPFMDGLQLSRILHETMPTIKIIILSGHDEFRYAQEAIHVGVTEYLLKPLSAQDLRAALGKVGHQLDREREASTQLAALQASVSDQQALLRERCILNIAVGNRASLEIIEQCQQLGIELVAPWYGALLVRVDKTAHRQFGLLQQLDAALAQTLNATPDIIWCKQDLVSTVVIVRGDSAELIVRAGQDLALHLRDKAAPIGASVTVGVGEPVERVSAIAQSFAQANAHLDATMQTVETVDSIKPNTAVLEHLLKSGVKADIERSLHVYLQPLGDVRGPVRKLIDSVLTDALLTVATLLRELGAQPEQVIPELRTMTTLLERITTFEQIQPIISGVLERTLDYRDRHTHHQRALIDRARDYIETHYADPDISLNVVATAVTLSPSYFSMLFGREVGETFIEFLTGVRVRHAMELLRTTALTSTEIAARVGYQNPRYFHAVFRKATGQSPIEFRRQA